MALDRLDHGVASSAMQALDLIRDGAQDRVVSPQVFTRLKRLPTLLRTSGLLPTLALFAAKSGKDDLGIAYEIVGAALRGHTCQALGWDDHQAGQALDLAFLRRLAEAAVAGFPAIARAEARLELFSAWLSRLAEALEREQGTDAPPSAEAAIGDGEQDVTPEVADA